MHFKLRKKETRVLTDEKCSQILFYRYRTTPLTMLRVPIGTISTEILRGYACSMHLVGKSGSLSPSDLERFVVVLWVDGLIVSVLLRQYNSSRFRCHTARNTCRMPTPSLFYTNCLCSLYICFVFFLLRLPRTKIVQRQHKNVVRQTSKLLHAPVHL